MKPMSAVAGLVCALSLTGCDLIEKATADRATTTQKRAAIDMLAQAGTIASIADDPSSTTAQDLIDALEMQHYVYMVSPEQKVTDAMNEQQAYVPVPDCITSDGNGTVTLTDCDVTLPGGRMCVVNGALTTTSTANATTVVGTLSLSAGDPDCLVQTWDDIDIVLEGPPDQPSSFRGQCDFTEDGDGNSYTGNLALDGVFIADGCDVPSGGSFTVTLDGMYNGEVVDGTFTGAFQADPCGDLLLE